MALNILFIPLLWRGAPQGRGGHYPPLEGTSLHRSCGVTPKAKTCPHTFAGTSLHRSCGVTPPGDALRRAISFSFSSSSLRTQLPAKLLLCALFLPLVPKWHFGTHSCAKLHFAPFSHPIPFAPPVPLVPNLLYNPTSSPPNTSHPP